MGELSYIVYGLISILCESIFLRMRLRGLSWGGEDGAGGPICPWGCFLPKLVLKCINKELKGVTYLLSCLEGRDETA